MKDALIVVDMQNDFIDGSLAVPEAATVIAPVNAAIGFAIGSEWPVIFTLDWHPLDSKHFSKWPVHCVRDSRGAMLHKNVVQPRFGNISYISKGLYYLDDGYSGFTGEELGGERRVLEDILSQNLVERVWVCGLALDYCVGETALDAAAHGFTTSVLMDCTRAVSPVNDMNERFIKGGVARSLLVTLMAR